MRKIDQIRDQIDKIDKKLLDLFSRRAKLAIQIGAEKSKRDQSNHFHVPPLKCKHKCSFNRLFS